MPTTVSNSVDTVNAAAAAIVTAESRVQPVSSQKSRWGSFWNLYWCFGSIKTSKRISHAALVPDPDVDEDAVAVPDNPHPSTSSVFVAPPSSPLPESDPPTGTHSPVGFLAVAPLSMNSMSCPREAHIFTIGPYAHETQLVSPPVFSAFTTEPSTAAITPPPEPVQFTTPSSPEVPFAQLLTSSLNRTRRNSGSGGGTHHKFALSCYELHHLISPGSANSASGTSSPYFDKRSVLEFRMIDASKLFDSKKIYTHTRKWGSRLGSGSITPDGNGFASPTDKIPMSHSHSHTHRVSFELISHEDSPKSQEVKIQETPLEVVADSCQLCAEETSNEIPETTSGEMEHCRHKRASFSLGSVKEFNFDNSDQETPVKSNPSTDWWADETVVRDIEAEENWSFYPVVQPSIS
ncbi:uncharacterized protein LOC141606815 [Silene latifolia]|uniref:uncharacterized protein LOC141606815 n=1 Tax=Silene latifolia TaxID=37657 RepID=UPI003D77108E